MVDSLDRLPRRIFLDSCTVQTLRAHGSFIWDGDSIPNDHRIHRVADGRDNVEALRYIFLVNERALFEWVVSDSSRQEAEDKHDARHLRWFYDILDHTEVCLEGDGPTPESEILAKRVDDTCFGYLSRKDRLFVRDAVLLRCDAFLTVERRLPRNAVHIERELGLRVLTPIGHWKMLQPWAALWL